MYKKNWHDISHYFAESCWCVILVLMLFHARHSGNLFHLNSRENGRKASRPVWPGFSSIQANGNDEGSGLSEWAVDCTLPFRDKIYIFNFLFCAPEPYVSTNTFYLIIRLNYWPELKQMNSWKKIKKRSGFPFPGLGMTKTYLLHLQYTTSPPPPPHPLTHRRALRIGKRENWF